MTEDEMKAKLYERECAINNALHVLGDKIAFGFSYCPKEAAQLAMTIEQLQRAVDHPKPRTEAYSPWPPERGWHKTRDRIADLEKENASLRELLDACRWFGGRDAIECVGCGREKRARPVHEGNCEIAVIFGEETE